MAKTNFSSYEKTANDPTTVGITDTGARVGFETMEQATKSGVNPDGSNIKMVDSLGASTPYSTYFPQKVSVNPPSVIPAESLVGNQVTTGDVKSLVNDVNLNYLEQQKALKFSPEELDVMKRRGDLMGDLRDLSTEKMQREVGIYGQGGEVGQAIVGRQINQLGRYIGYKQLPIINEIQALSEVIGQYQAQRTQTLKQLEISMNQGQFNLGLAKEYDAQKRAEQEKIKDLIIKSGISARYAEVNGTVYDSATGEALSLAEFQKRTGQTVGLPSSQTNFKMVEGLEGAANKLAYKALVNDLASKYFDAGVLPTDTIESATAKIKANSAIYREQVRPPSSGGGGGGKTEALQNDIQSNAAGLVQTWKDNGWLNSGYIGSGEYKTAKAKWVSQYAGKVDNPGEKFDDYFSVYVNSNSINWQDHYGINSDRKK